MSRSNSSQQQIELQRESLALQKQQAADNVSFMQMQLEELRKNQVAPYKAMSPPPTAGTSGGDYAAYQQLVAENRRYGFGDTVRGGMRTGLGGGRKVA